MLLSNRGPVAELSNEWPASLVVESLFIKCRPELLEVSQVLFRLSRWENLEHAKKI